MRVDRSAEEAVLALVSISAFTTFGRLSRIYALHYAYTLYPKKVACRTCTCLNTV